MWELDCEEGWAPKNWCFWTVVLEKTLESPLDWRSNQSILKEISPGCWLEGVMLKLKLQYFGHLMWRVDSLERTLMLGGIRGRRRRDDRGWDGWKTSPTQWTWVWVNSRSWWWTGRPGVLLFMGWQRIGHDWATELNWNYQLINLASYKTENQSNVREFLQAHTTSILQSTCVCASYSTSRPTTVEELSLFLKLIPMY